MTHLIKFICLIIVLLGFWATTTTHAAPIVISTFDTGTEDWLAKDITNNLANPPIIDRTFAPTFSPSGGNPGGFISATDPSTNFLFFSAPAGFLGDKSTAFGGSLAFDTKTNFGPGETTVDVALVSPTTTLYYVSSPPPLTDWVTFVVPLSASSSWRLNNYYTGGPPTDAQMQAVLGNLSALYISADWVGGFETTSLDNVILSSPVPSAVPDPPTLLLLAAGLIGLWGVRGRLR